jgi:transposase
MPLENLNRMDHKIHVISDYLRCCSTFSDLCARYGISRKTGYPLVRRYHSEGLKGL